MKNCYFLDSGYLKANFKETNEKNVKKSNKPETYFWR